MTELLTNNHRINAVLAWLTGLVIAVILSALVFSQLNRVVWQQQADGARLILDQVVAMREESVAIVTTLNALGVAECSASLLKRMQKELFFSSHIRDIRYTEDGALVCSTSQGLLEAPQPEPEASFITILGFQFWPQTTIELLGQSIEAPMAGEDNFNVIFDDTGITSVIARPYEWQLVYNDGTKIRPVLGEAGIYSPHESVNARTASLSNHTYSECIPVLPYCVAVTVSNMALAKHHLSLLTLLLGACLVAGLGAGQLAWNLLRKQSSPRNRLRNGLKRKAFYPVFQPIVDLNTGEIIGCEVLARFKDRFGPLFPDQFIPLLSQMGLTWAFTRTIIRQALNKLENNETIPDGFLVNFNLSPIDIASGKVRDLARIPAGKNTRLQLNFEITEDLQLDSGTAHSHLRWIREQGWGLALDDFGTGYCNLSQIRDLKCDTLKIDRSFITDIEDGGIRQSMLPIMLQLAEKLELKVVAEGIENEQQRDIIQGLDVAFGQGWFFGRPMSARKLALLISHSTDDKSHRFNEPVHTTSLPE